MDEDTFRLEECTRVMIDTVLEYLRTKKTPIDRVYFVLFDHKRFRIFDQYAKVRWTD